MKKTVEKEISVRFENITKTFGSVIANEDITFDVYKGEILSLLGENGSGKTTLMNMLAGIYLPDEGRIFVGGKEVTISSPRDAFDNHIGMIHQHFRLVDVFTAAENVVLGLDEPGRLDIKAASAVHEWEEEDAAEAERLAKEAEEMAEAGLDKAPADEVDALDDVQADELEPAEEGSAEDEAAEE